MSLSLDNLPPLKKSVDLSDVKSSSKTTDLEKKDKPFIIVHSREVELEEKELLRSYGTILEWHPSFQNIPLTSHKFEYCLVDVNNKDARMLLMKTDLSLYHVVILCRRWEQEDDFVNDCQSENVLRRLPPRQAFKQDFDTLLLSSKIRQPNCGKALIRFLWKAVDGF
jgi:hypothetical protein